MAWHITSPLWGESIDHKGMFTYAQAGAGGKLASTQIITCVHTCAVAERRRSGSKNRSARNGSNTQFTAPASKPRAPNHHCPQEMTDPPASTPRMCEHTRGSGAGISKSARRRSATAPRMCKRSLRLMQHHCNWRPYTHDSYCIAKKKYLQSKYSTEIQCCCVTLCSYHLIY